MPKSKSLSKQSPLFNAPDADIIIYSSDNVQFLLHTNNLACNTGAFPWEAVKNLVDPDHNVSVVQLPEPAWILETLFQFIYPRRYDTIISSLRSRFSFWDYPKKLLSLAKAADKYEVANFFFPCEVELTHSLSDYDDKDMLTILKIVAKHNHYPKLMNILMNALKDMALSEISKVIPDPVLYKRWSIDRERRLLNQTKELEVYLLRRAAQEKHD
ncbi:hypothetical protein FB446DRAFT_224961 [Lentinula raphanica]|nr:hypothetical protein FB446DRAFT_224961 [Lentinula raphanica]